MHRYHFSIRTLLLIIISILNLLIAVPLGIMAYKSYINYNNAKDVRHITDTLQYLYTTKKYLALERASSVALLYVEPDAFASLKNEINAAREQSEKAFNTALEFINSRADIAIPLSLQTVQKSFDDLNDFRLKLDTGSYLIKNNNPTAFSEQYFNTIVNLNTNLDSLINEYSKDIGLLDAGMARLARQTGLIWGLSEYASQEYAILGRLIAQNKFPDVPTQDKLINLRGRINYGFEIVENSISASRWKEDIGPQLDEAKTHYLMVFEQIKNEFYYASGESNEPIYPVTVEMWLQLASDAVNSLNDMTDKALGVNAQYVKEIQESAKRSINIIVLLLICALALSFYTWWLITTRVVKPVNAMVEALYKETKINALTITENDRLDEITKLEAVLKVFRENLRQLETERDKAQAANVAKSEFLANMSHEIRTPMNVVVGLSNILSKSSPLNEKQVQYINTLKISANALLSLINDLLDFSKIEASNLELEKTPFDFSNLIHELVQIKSFKAREKGLEFYTDIQNIEGKNYMGDPTRIRQILMNLCGNAIKFTDKGFVKLVVKSSISPKNNVEIITIEVTDTGIGISNDKFDYIFEKFTQADASIVRKYGGTGLGLAITKSFVEMMDGTIHVQSELGQGTTFTARIPLSVDSYTQKNEEILTEAPPPEDVDMTAKVLLVEDYAPNALVAGTLLEDFGYSYDVAENGIDAVQKYMENEYQIILMDVQMPGMDGYEATRAIREYERDTGKGKAKIIGLTAHATAKDQNKCLDAGMNGYLPKPFEAKDLLNKLRT